MKIGELAEKYNVSAREVDYWTNLGLLHSVDQGVGYPNSYRNYGEASEREIKKILILKAMGLTLNEEHMSFLNAVPKDMIKEIVIDRIERERNKTCMKFDDALDFAGELLGS